MKENGIGRPSTRASIIETLFRRNYIIRNKKQILPTAIGIDLIGIIQNSLLKSAELTGQWEKKLKEIERSEYQAGSFINQMKSMVDHLVYEVRSENSGRYISMDKTPEKKHVVKKKRTKKSINNRPCPKCKKGKILKGKKAYGCSNHSQGCDYLFPFDLVREIAKEKRLTEKLVFSILSDASYFDR